MSGEGSVLGAAASGAGVSYTPKVSVLFFFALTTILPMKTGDAINPGESLMHPIPFQFNPVSGLLERGSCLCIPLLSLSFTSKVRSLLNAL